MSNGFITPLDRYNGVSPSMNIEPMAACPYGAVPTVVDTPETPWQAQARSSCWEKLRYLFSDAYYRATIYPLADTVTWDYASPLMYSHMSIQPYPYVLER